MSTIQHLVYGERLGDLRPVLRAITQRAHLVDEGMFVFEGRFEPHTATPFIRALMRAEAELLLEDADALQPGRYEEQRTSDQRAVDALVRLAQAVCAFP